MVLNTYLCYKLFVGVKLIEFTVISYFKPTVVISRFFFYSREPHTRLFYVCIQLQRITILEIQLVSYKRYLECTLVQWGLSIYP